MAFPDSVAVKIGLTNSLGRQIVFDASTFDDTTRFFGTSFAQSFDGAYDDVSAHVERIQTSRGRDDLLTEMAAGQATVVLRDPPGQVGYFNPESTTSPLYSESPGLKPMRPIQVTATLGGTVYPVFSGFLRSASYERENPSMGRLTLIAVDLFMWLSRVKPRDAGKFTGTIAEPTPTESGDAVTLADATAVQTTGSSKTGLMKTTS